MSVTLNQSFSKKHISQIQEEEVDDNIQSIILGFGLNQIKLQLQIRKRILDFNSSSTATPTITVGDVDAKDKEVL